MSSTYRKDETRPHGVVVRASGNGHVVGDLAKISGCAMTKGEKGGGAWWLTEELESELSEPLGSQGGDRLSTAVK